jgi:hypothetical protein
MKFRRRQRWLRRFAFAFAVVMAVAAGRVAPAFAKFDDGGSKGHTVVTAGGWSGAVDPDTGIPLSAGIPQGDEPFLSDTSSAPAGDEIAINAAIADRNAAAASSIHDPFLSDIHVRPGESLGGPDGTEPLMTKDDWTVVPYLSHGILTQADTESFVQGVTDFPVAASVAVRPDDRAERVSPVNPPVISYLSHGMGNAGEVGARPDDRSARFTPGMVASPSTVEVAGDGRDWSSPLTMGLGFIVLGLALGLAFGYLRRPRLAL